MDVGRGGAAPPHPPYWPAFGRREILERLGIRPRLYDTPPQAVVVVIVIVVVVVVKVVVVKVVKVGKIVVKYHLPFGEGRG